jgi:hypothetical protein
MIEGAALSQSQATLRRQHERRDDQQPAFDVWRVSHVGYHIQIRA